ncbi:dihydrofolate reductase [Nocardioides sp. NPDC047086]|uniref:dihydrofolate reductase family protein n=1 Tax=Nocardioides sp. NPDC047086 TaxID=3154810 RepID=UPI0033C2F38B
MAGKVLWHLSMSLDGFVDAREPRMAWLGDVTGPPGVAEAYSSQLGAVLGGRNGHDAYPDAMPYGDWVGPVFILTHHPEDARPQEHITFLSCDVGEALRIAVEAADGKNVEVYSADPSTSSGHRIGRQLLERGLIDQIDLHVAPVLLGDGIRLYDNPGGDPIRLHNLIGEDPHLEVDLRYSPVCS